MEITFSCRDEETTLIYQAEIEGCNEELAVYFYRVATAMGFPVDAVTLHNDNGLYPRETYPQTPF